MLLINASNLYVGGGVQVAISLLEEFSKLDRDYVSVVSPVVFEQLSIKAKEKCILINTTPSKILNFKGRRELDKIVLDFNIRTVLTIFGPSYWSPKNVVHIVGFALPWLIYANKNMFSILSFKEKLKTLLLSRLQPYFYKKNADFIVTETKDASDKVKKLLSFKDCDVFTISNTLNAIFKDTICYDYSIESKLPNKNDGDYWLLSISHDYPHKNMRIIYDLLELLPDNYKFITTLPCSFTDGLSDAHKERIITLGRVNSNQCPVLYQKCDAMFLPTLLECFSASYLEAMFMKKIIITSNRDFSRSVCEKHAFYFDPLDPKDISDSILDVSRMSTSKIENVLLSAYIHGETFPTAKERAKAYLSLIDKVKKN
ncbi:glycosyltransferase [Pseudocitrobacter vendiensis]|uniref:glycosyltransferase n=1 Tax=Pseudocitrobacter vendiensis TaxID=2488306 RepID=UPI0020A28D45|nr:glycosyltransferase [Pseudocitrobacter vendiensis]